MQSAEQRNVQLVREKRLVFLRPHRCMQVCDFCHLVCFDCLSPLLLTPPPLSLSPLSRTQEEFLHNLGEEVSRLRAELSSTKSAADQLRQKEAICSSHPQCTSRQDAWTSTADDTPTGSRSVSHAILGSEDSAKGSAARNDDSGGTDSVEQGWICASCKQTKERTAPCYLQSGRRRSKSLPSSPILKRKDVHSDGESQNTFSEDEGVYSEYSGRENQPGLEVRRRRRSRSASAGRAPPVAFGRHFRPLARCSHHGGTACRSCREQLQFSRARITSLQQQVRSAKKKDKFHHTFECDCKPSLPTKPLMTPVSMCITGQQSHFLVLRSTTV